MEFSSFLNELANHEEAKQRDYLSDPRRKLLVFSGIHLNWIADFLANPKVVWEERELPIDNVEFSGTGPEWNEVLIKQSDRSVQKFRQLISQNPSLKKKFEQEASFGSEPILVRASGREGYYKVLDGMHRFVGAALSNNGTVRAFVPINEKNHLPICEPHTVYDLIRGYQRHAYDKAGKLDLYHGLKLLARSYENVPSLLKERFNRRWVDDDSVQEVISKVLAEIS